MRLAGAGWFMGSVSVVEYSFTPSRRRRTSLTWTVESPWNLSLRRYDLKSLRSSSAFAISSFRSRTLYIQSFFVIWFIVSWLVGWLVGWLVRQDSLSGNFNKLNRSVSFHSSQPLTAQPVPDHQSMRDGGRGIRDGGRGIRDRG